MKLDSCLMPVTEINLKCIKDLNMRPESLKAPRHSSWPQFLGYDSKINKSKNKTVIPAGEG